MKDNLGLLAVDIGSSSAKAALYLEDGRAVAESHVEHRPRRPAPGVAVYDAEEVFLGASAAVRDVLEARPDVSVEAMAVDGGISGVLGVGSDGRATTPWITTLDSRAEKYSEAAIEHWGDEIRNLTGACQPDIAARICWIRDEDSGAFLRTRKFTTVAGYVAARFGGLRDDALFIDPTYLWATGVADARLGDWSGDLCDAMGIPVEKLPRIVSSLQVVGRTTSAQANLTGIKTGIPIAAGAGDSAAALLGAGVVRVGDMADVAGTYAGLAITTDRFEPSSMPASLQVVAGVVPNCWHLCTYVIGGGATLEWFVRQALGGDELSLDRLEADASILPPGSEGLVFIPYFGGRACPRMPEARGAWVGLGWFHRREHLYKSILESIAYDHRLAIEALPERESRVTGRFVTGFGGGSQSGLWNQIKADVLGVEYIRSDRAEVATRGSALIAGAAVGLFGDLQSAALRVAGHGEHYPPRLSVHQQYKPHVDLYLQTIEALRPVFKRMSPVSPANLGTE